MIYLRDEATGVTVEDTNPGLWADASQPEIEARGVHAGHRTCHRMTAAEADALLRGLLRWKLETTGGTDFEKSTHVAALVSFVIGEWRRGR